MRRLPSGRYQAFYVRSGARVVAERTFRTKTEAGAWLAVEAVRNAAPSALPRSALTVGEATEAWIASRRLAPQTEERYCWLVRRHRGPIAAMPVRNVTTQDVAAWLPAGVAGAKVYRLLSAVMRQLVADGVIPRSPCTIRGAGTEHTAERPVATVSQAMALAEAMAPWGVAVHLAARAHLRRGEVLGLDWSDIEGDVVHVRRARVRIASGQEFITTPKTPASYRMVTIPAPIVDLIGTGQGPVVQFTSNSSDAGGTGRGPLLASASTSTTFAARASPGWRARVPRWQNLWPTPATPPPRRRSGTSTPRGTGTGRSPSPSDASSTRACTKDARAPMTPGPTRRDSVAPTGLSNRGGARSLRHRAPGRRRCDT